MIIRHLKGVSALSPAAEAIRRNLLIRTPEFTRRDFSVPPNAEILRSALDEAYSFHAAGCDDDFDYLRHSIRSVRWRFSTFGTLLHRNTVAVCSVSYLTSAEEEAETSRRLDRLFRDDAVYAMTPYAKVRYAYDYITRNVRYDESCSRFSACQALLEGCVVCAGCSALLYRMLARLSVPVRIVTGNGQGERHPWNMIGLDGQWYAADVTWDLGKTGSEYRFFLKGRGSFPDHTTNAPCPVIWSPDDYVPRLQIRPAAQSG